MKIEINVDMYSVLVVVVTSFDEFKALHKDAENDRLFVTVDYGDRIYVLVSDEWSDMHDHRFIQCLSHELNHASMCLLNNVGIKFDYENQEVLCYLQDYLMSKVFKKINKLNKDLL